MDAGACEMLQSVRVYDCPLAFKISGKSSSSFSAESRLQHSDYQENHQDHDDHAKETRWSVTPATAVPPGG
jgi:hypothetical protein